MQSNSPFVLTIAAQDRFSPVFANVGRALKGVDRALSGIPRTTGKTARETEKGVGGLRTSFEGLRRSATGLGRTLGDVVEPLKGTPFLGAELTFAGLAAATYGLTDHWARFGQQVLFTSQNLGIGVEKLQAFQGGARLAGASAEAMTSGLGALQERLNGAAWGRDPVAIATFRQLGIAVRDAGGNVRTMTDVLPQLADAVAAQKNPWVQAELATRMFGEAGRQLLPYLRLGSAGIRRYNEDATKYGLVTKEQAERARQFEQSQTRVSLAVEGLRTSIAAELAPVVGPMLTQLADWIKSNRTLVGEDVAAWAKKFGDRLKETDWKEVGQDIKNIAAAVADLAGWIGKSIKGWSDFVELLNQAHQIDSYKLPEPAPAKRRQFEQIEQRKETQRIFGTGFTNWLADAQKRGFGAEFWHWLTAPAAKSAPSPAARAAITPQPAPVSLFSRGGIVPAAARGWEVPAAFGSDTVPAMLTPGEMVLPRDLSLGFRALIRAGSQTRPAAPGNVAHRLAEALPTALGRADYDDMGRAIADATGAGLTRELPEIFTQAWRRANTQIADTGVPIARDGQAAIALLGSLGMLGGVPAPHLGAAPAPQPFTGAPILPKGAIDPSIRHGIDFFTRQGLSLPQAEGVVARLAAESGGHALDPMAVNAKSGAYGIAQWLGQRKPAALATGGDLDRQLGLVWHELQTTERSALTRIRATRTAGDAAVAMESFERAGEPAFTAYAGRLAEGFAKRFAAPPVAGLTMPAPAPAVAPIYAEGGAAAAAVNRDTRHQVEVSFANAPPGMRAGVAGADGPADVDLRVRYAMGPV